MTQPQPVRQIKAHIDRLIDELVNHEGFGEFRVEMRLLKRGQKEVLIHCGKQYRYVIDFATPGPGDGAGEG